MLAGALFGLLGQEAAYAGGLPLASKEPVSIAAAQMSPECADAMGLAKQAQLPDEPCQGMTPDCIAKMGCAVPAALLPLLAFDASLQLRAALPSVLPVASLVGRETAPDPDPPSRLG